MRVITTILLCFVLGASKMPTDKTKILTRRWVLVDVYTQKLEKNLEIRGISLERRNEVIEELTQGSFLDFRPDGTYEVSILGSKPEFLYWKLSDDDAVLWVRKRVSDEFKAIDIEVLTKKELIIVLNQPLTEQEYLRLSFQPDPESGALFEGE